MSTKALFLAACTSALAGVSAPTAVAVTKTQGDAGVTETASLAFQDLIAGQSVTVEGLTLSASGNILAADVASGFASLLPEAAKGNLVTNGSWSGALSADWSSGEASTATVLFTSKTAETNVTDIVVSSAGTAAIESSDLVAAIVNALDAELTSRLTFPGMRVQPPAVNIAHTYDALITAVEALE